jgi:hypothetical protein
MPTFRGANQPSVNSGKIESTRLVSSGKIQATFRDAMPTFRATFRGGIQGCEIQATFRGAMPTSTRLVSSGKIESICQSSKIQITHETMACKIN